MKILSDQLLDKLVSAHSKRVVSNWDQKLLEDYAFSQYKDSFSKNPGCADTDQDSVIEDLINYEGGDLEAASKFLQELGIDKKTAEELLG